MARILVGLAAVLTTTTIAFACGTERWAVKTGTDRDAGNVATEPETATIADLTAINSPHNPNSRKSSRFAPTELKTFQITGILSVIKKEKDQDYHLVITDPSDTELTMIVESPDPSCADSSQFMQQITDVRQTIDRQFGSFRRTQPNMPVTLTGIAFFDPLHGQEGVASNGIELHPLLSIQFQDAPAAAPSGNAANPRAHDAHPRKRH
jgi:hypothetical protein